jgi:hypothetical protein
MYPNNSFIIDVFDLLDLDFQEYANKGVYSYANLISGNKNENKELKRILEDGVLTDQVTNGDKADADFPDEEKDIQNHKKEDSPFVASTYQPDYLDDENLTELTAGKNRTCLKFASYSVSIIDYVKPLDLKIEMNETFKEKFPYIQISLTKLRSIKRELLEIAYQTSLDIIIVAQSYIYFEKLILQGLINKVNRKFLAGNCLILASKLNDVTKKDINRLIENTISKFRLDSRKELISYEFPILVALEFNLMEKYENSFNSHFERITGSLHNLKLNDSLQHRNVLEN